MFPDRFFPQRYFPNRYFPVGSGEAGAATDFYGDTPFVTESLAGTLLTFSSLNGTPDVLLPLVAGTPSSVVSLLGEITSEVSILGGGLINR